MAAFSASAGLLLNRVDVGIFGYFRSAHAVYFPSLVEWALSLGVVAAAALVFLAFVEHAPIFQERPTVGLPKRPFRASFDSLSGVWQTALSSGLERTTIIAVLVVPLAWALMYPTRTTLRTAEVHPASRLDVTGAELRLDGDRAGLVTVFPHADCQRRLGGDSSCVACHHMSLPGDTTTPCSQCHRRMYTETMVFDHAAHIQAVADSLSLPGPFPSNRSCVTCHDETSAKTAATAKSCVDCHQEWTAEYANGTKDLSRAPGYFEAMHGTCLKCHEDEAEKQDRPELRECSTCHKSLTPRSALQSTLAERQ